MLDKDDNIVKYKARLHWIIFAMPTIFLVIMLYLHPGFYYSVFFLKPNILFTLVGLVWEIIVFINYKYSYLLVYNKKVVLCSGFLAKTVIDIPVSKIESIDVRQSILGGILNYGAVIITGTGGSVQFMNFVHDPLRCKNYVIS
jgi:uncharacterized membrane protein YdbT with pleckstrin-like domain